MIVLGIESTCDETAASIVKDGQEILSNVVASQIDLHSLYGGVVPELACRKHIDVILPVIDRALKDAGLHSIQDVDLICVAKGPGLIGALLIGINTAKALAFAAGKPWIGVNHIEAHIYAAMMQYIHVLQFPLLGVVISGGHTSLLEISELGSYRLLGQTIDDAVGEAFDKVASMLDLPYPGGPNIEEMAKKGDRHRYPFKAGVVKGRPLDFSYSGLKTSVLYTIKGQNKSKGATTAISEEDKPDVAASFQHHALIDIVNKCQLAIKEYNLHGIVIGGGVSNNQYLRQLFASQIPDVPVYFPPAGLSLDNAAMIAGLGYHQFMKTKTSDSFDLEPMTRIPF